MDILEACAEWRAHCQPPGAGETQIRETQLAFYAGALAMLGVIKRLADEAEPDELEEGADAIDVEVEKIQRRVHELVHDHLARGGCRHA